MCRFFVVVGLAVSLQACTVRDSRFDVTTYRPHGDLLPPDIVGRPARGVYASKASELDAALCCWMGPEADFTVRKRGLAHRLSIHVYVPDLAPFTSKLQKIKVDFPGHHEELRSFAAPRGFSTFEVALPTGMSQFKGPIRVQLTSHLSFLPPGASNQRRYAAVITAIYFH